MYGIKNQYYGICAVTIIAGAIMSSCGANQTDSAYKDSTDYKKELSGTRTKLDKALVPKAVTDRFGADYPMTTYDYWFGYPAQDDWYGYDHDYSDQNPATYVVEFATDSIPYRAVYTKEGAKIATYKSISVLPDAVSWALNNGDYKTWTVGKEKQEIFKDKDADTLKVYMVTVEKLGHKHILYFQSDRRLMKDKTIS
jgi:hypothetical protein